jgi:hypothetical protein
MKKAILVFVAGLIVFLSALPVFAVDLKFNGDFRVRGFYTDNLTDQADSANDASAYNSMRFLLTTTASAGIAKGVVTMDFTSTGGTGNMRFGETGGAYGPKDDTFALLEAYIKADLQMAMLSAGRQVFKIGHGILFEDPADGFFLDVPLGPAKLTLVNLKPFDCSELGGSNNPAIGTGLLGTCSGTGNDTDLYFTNLSLRPTGDMASNLFFGVYKDRGPNIGATGAAETNQFATSTSDVELYIVGATGNASLGPLNLNAEIDYLTGDMDGNTQNADLDGLNVQVGGSTTAGPANVGLTFVYASGKDPNSNDRNINGLDGNFPIGIILTNGGARSLAPKDGTCLGVSAPGFTDANTSLGGVPNCVNSRGLLAIKGTGSISPVERLSLQADVIWAQSAEDSSTAFPEKDIGVELDGTARYKLDDNFSLMTGIGYLIAGDFFKTATNTDPDDMIVIVGEMSYHF